MRAFLAEHARQRTTVRRDRGSYDATAQRPAATLSAKEERQPTAASRTIHIFCMALVSVTNQGAKASMIRFHNGRANLRKKDHAWELAIRFAANVAAECPSCRLHILHNVPKFKQEPEGAAHLHGARLHFVDYSASALPPVSPHNFRHRAILNLLPYVGVTPQDCVFMIDGDATLLRDLAPLCHESHRTGRVVVGSDDCRLHPHTFMHSIRASAAASALPLDARAMNAEHFKGWIYWMKFPWRGRTRHAIPNDVLTSIDGAQFSVNAGILGASAAVYAGLTRSLVATMASWQIPFSDMLAVWWHLHRNGTSGIITGWPNGPVNGPFENRLCTAHCLTAEQQRSFYFAHKFNGSRVALCQPDKNYSQLGTKLETMMLETTSSVVGGKQRGPTASPPLPIRSRTRNASSSSEGHGGQLTNLSVTLGAGPRLLLPWTAELAMNAAQGLTQCPVPTVCIEH